MAVRSVCGIGARVVVHIAVHRMAAGAMVVAILGCCLADAVPMRVMVMVDASELMHMPIVRGWGDSRGR